jgi:serine/threonine-protein phosphatase 2A regulatory subunit A
VQAPARIKYGSIYFTKYRKFAELSNEETPMVRRVIAIKIGEMATVYEKEYIVADLIPAFKQLSTDDQDLVRVPCLDSLNSLARVLSR